VYQVDLEKKLDTAIREKGKYRQHLEKALEKIAATHQKEQSAVKAHLLKEKRELEHMRLRYMAADEKKVISSEQRELEDLKNELSQLVLFLLFLHLPPVKAKDAVFNPDVISVLLSVCNRNAWNAGQRACKPLRLTTSDGHKLTEK